MCKICENMNQQNQQNQQFKQVDKYTKVCINEFEVDYFREVEGACLEQLLDGCNLGLYLNNWIETQEEILEMFQDWKVKRIYPYYHHGAYNYQCSDVIFVFNTSEDAENFKDNFDPAEVDLSELYYSRQGQSIFPPEQCPHCESNDIDYDYSNDQFVETYQCLNCGRQFKN